MTLQPARMIGAVAAILFLSGAAIAVSNGSRPSSQETGAASKAPASAVELIAVAPPPFTEGVFPCSQCHLEEDEVNHERRELAYHDEIIFEHDIENRWCLDCHDAHNRDSLRLADGRLLSFNDSYRLCGQCHGTQFRDWRAGEHGKRTGSWSGTKEYLLCVNCHNPHSPKIKHMKPLPPPVRQENIK